MSSAIQLLRSQLRIVLDFATSLGAPTTVRDCIQQQGDLFPLLEWASVLSPPPKELLALACTCLKTRVYAHPSHLEEELLPLMFGTGGHRGKLGYGLTILHVHAIVKALIEQVQGMSSVERLEYCGSSSVEEVKKRGFILGHDNRLFNEDFACYAAWLLSESGFRADYVGRMASPQLSLLTPKLGWAGSLNFTPSHNPFCYGGIKYSPTDGGLADVKLTDPLTERANKFLQALSPEDWLTEAELRECIKQGRERAQLRDGLSIHSLHNIYLDSMDTHPAIRLKELAAELHREKDNHSVLMVADPVWGAAVPVYHQLQKRLGTDVLRLLHTEENPFFDGQNTEPSPDTLQDALSELNKQGALQIAVRNDPDGDRGLVGDAYGAISMNQFSALVSKYLLDIGYRGALVTSYASSHFAQQYTQTRGCQVHLTPTGFKNFRPWLKNGAMVAYEESNGITIANHTLDKDGILSGLLAMRIALHYQKPLSALVTSLEKEVGKHYWQQEAFAIQLSVVQVQEKFQALDKIHPGYVWKTSRGEYQVKQISRRDGYKFYLNDDSWLMLRPSGTEPKMRVYAESLLSEAATAALCEAGKQMALDLMR